jgi:glucuronate isomerase
MNEKNKPGFTERLIREANVDLCINSTLEGQNEGRLLVQDSAVKCFKPVLFMAGLFVPNYGNIKSIEEITGLKIKNLDGLLAAADWYIEKYAKSSACIKFNLAYARKIYFPEVEKNEAEKAFADFLSDTKNTASEKIESYQNFLIHYIIEKAAAEDLPIQFHTGLTTVNRTMLENVDPKLLCNLFLKYPQAKFVLLHIGYPFYQEAITLAKLFSNVYLDMAWIWIVDSISSKDFLKKYLATAAVNKLFAFGGDFVSPDLIFGHLELARIGISEVLAELVEAKRIDIDRAKFIADRILRENAVEFYNSKQTGIQ